MDFTKVNPKKSQLHLLCSVCWSLATIRQSVESHADKRHQKLPGEKVLLRPIIGGVRQQALFHFVFYFSVKVVVFQACFSCSQYRFELAEGDVTHNRMN